MKRTLRKMRAVIRRSALTKGIITYLLAGAGILSFLVLAGESDPAASMTEVLTAKAYAALVMIMDIVLFRAAYRSRLLIDEAYEDDEVPAADRKNRNDL